MLGVIEHPVRTKVGILSESKNMFAFIKKLTRCWITKVVLLLVMKNHIFGCRSSAFAADNRSAV